ncbi:clathrin heavy-chain terminal domain-containing protein [Exidia glandulosa HHB12029]|uniref:Clathrin heavy-chain terminal domain-containing protein n=1 Tax=Exidia glandulosa HHB12029 TaxID=1314781 RepID=A0A166BI40_EXIGL|nr:clathrin heavy-chain terminal domain-containing protein [Exidia glandulosa HHB12029]
MAASQRPLIVTHYDHLLRVEGSLQGKIEHVNLSSNRAVCITQVQNKQKKTLALDMDDHDPVKAVQTWQNTEDGAMNSQSKLVVLVGAKGVLYVCDADTGMKLETQRMNDDIELVRWISNSLVAVVTRTAVYHWQVNRNRCLRPDEWFIRDPALRSATIVDYRICQDGAYAALIAHEPTINARESIAAEGLVQLYSRQHATSKIIEGHAFDLVEADLTGYPRGMVLALSAKRTLMTSELRLMEIIPDTGPSGFGTRTYPLNFPHDAYNDYPISIHVSSPLGIIFLTTRLGFLHLYDMETGEQLISQRITRHKVLCTAQCDDGAGIMLVDENYNATGVTINDDNIIPYLLSTGFDNIRTLFRIADRNTNWRLFAKHHLQLCVMRKEEAEAYLKNHWCSYESAQPMEDTGRLSARLWAGDGSLGVTETAAYTLRGIVLFLAGLLPDSLKYARTALVESPDDRDARMLLWRAEDVTAYKAEGNAAYHRGEYATAIEWYTKTLKHIGEQKDEFYGGIIRATILSNRAAAYLRTGKHKEAIADVTTSLEIVPEAWKALRTRGNAYLALRNFDKALADLTKAVLLCHIPDEKTKLQRELAEAQRGVRGPHGYIPIPLGVQSGRSTPAMVPGKDYYRILNVPRTASEAEIRQAFRQRSIALHPRNGGNPEGYKLLEEAHRMLANSVTRRQYDATLLSFS